MDSGKAILGDITTTEEKIKIISLLEEKSSSMTAWIIELEE